MSSLTELRKEAKSLGRDAFLARYREAALVLGLPADAPPAAPDDPTTQTSVGSFSANMDSRMEDIGMNTKIVDIPGAVPLPRMPPGLEPGASVFFVSKSDRNPFKTMITVGRAQNNDIVLPVSVVSKFHAYITTQGEAQFIQDQASTNGTIVDGKRVLKGESRPLKDGSTIELAPGLVLRYHTPAGFFETLVSSAGSESSQRSS